MFFQLKNLAKNNEVHLVAIDKNDISKSDFDRVASFCKSLHVYKLPLYLRILQLFLCPFNHRPLQVAYFYNRSIKQKIHQLSRDLKPDLVHSHLIRTTEYVKELKGVKKSVDFMDAFGKGMEKRQKNTQNFFKRLLFSFEKKLLYTYEARLFEFFDEFCIISEQDKTAIQSEKSSKIHVIPNGVDFETFYPRETAKKYDLLFMGNLGYPPNVDAILYLSKEVMPELLKFKPNIKLLLAGINAPKRIKELASENIDLIANFDDISDAIAMSKILVAPMITSIGLQNKIIQAMAMKVPCVVTTQANAAIKAQHNLSIIEANTPDEISKAILNLLNDPEKANDIASAGYFFVSEKFSWNLQNELFTKLIINKN